MNVYRLKLSANGEVLQANHKSAPNWNLISDIASDEVTLTEAEYLAFENTTLDHPVYFDAATHQPTNQPQAPADVADEVVAAGVLEAQKRASGEPVT